MAKLDIYFIKGSEPLCMEGDMRCLLAVVRGKTGKARTVPAYYLNRYPLEYQDPCDERGCPKDENHDDGCPTTGWFYDESNFEYDNCYHALEGEVIAWAALPTGEVVDGLIHADTEHTPILDRELARLRQEQAARVMPVVTSLLDFWEMLPNDERDLVRTSPRLACLLDELDAAMEAAAE